MQHFRSTSGRTRAPLVVLSLLAAGGLATIAHAQDGVTPGADAPEWVQKLAINPDSAQSRRYSEQQRIRANSEKELRKLRLKYFGAIKKQEIRQTGILKLRAYSDPALFPTLVEVFEREDADVRGAVMDIFAESRTQEGDASLAWVAIFDRSAEVRRGATSRLQRRTKEEAGTPEGVKLVCWEGIRSGKPEAMASAAGLANDLTILEAIPWLINAQVQFAGVDSSGGGGTRQGALAWILVGTQTAFVSDLTPVVGPNAVAFDPQLSVITEGVILRVLDAAVVSYNYDLHNVLEQLGSRGMEGADLRGLGWNVPAWRNWYAGEFKPFQAKKKADALAKAAEESSQGIAADQTAPK